LLLNASSGPAPARKVLVAWSRGGHDTPAYVAAHAAWIESRPFDGIVIDDKVGLNLMSTDPTRLPELRDSTGAFSVAGARTALAPLDRTTFRRFTTNLAKVNLGYDRNPPDLFDDAGWAIVLSSARSYASALEPAGIAGVLIDDEVYTYKYWQFPRDVKDPERGLPGYAAQARRRGRELIAAFRAGFPAITALVLHGPYLGCTAARKPVISWSVDSNLVGAFAAGMIEGAEPPSVAIDGGELYQYRTDAEFERSYQWRRDSILTTRAACPFMDDALRAVWPARIDLGFGVYDKERPPSRVGGWQPITDPARLESKLALALTRADRLVWLYSEAWDWWADSSTTSRYPKPSEPWLQAVRDARAAAGLDR
jgi:hypothetical protein